MNRKNIKLIITAILVFVLCFAFISCGDTNDDATNDGAGAANNNNNANGSAAENQDSGGTPPPNEGNNVETPAVVEEPAAPNIPDIPRTNIFRVNCGGEEYTDPNGNVWAADKEYVEGSHGWIEGASWFFEGPYENTELQGLFETLMGEYIIEYQFDDILPGNYNVKIFTSEPRWFDEDPETLEKSRIFNITLNNTIVEENLNPYEYAGFKVAIVKEYTFEVTDGSLNIFIEASRDLAVLNAIEITPVS